MDRCVRRDSNYLCWSLSMQMPYLHSITARHASISARPANHGIFPASSRFFSQPFPKRCRFRPWCRDFSYFTRNNFHLTSSWTGRNWSKQKLSEKKPIRILRKWNWNLALDDSSNDQTWRRRRNTIDTYREERIVQISYDGTNGSVRNGRVTNITLIIIFRVP